MNTIAIGLEEGGIYLPVFLGCAIVLRVVRLPDFSLSGAALLGGALGLHLIDAGVSLQLAVALSAAACLAVGATFGGISAIIPVQVLVISVAFFWIYRSLAEYFLVSGMNSHDLAPLTVGEMYSFGLVIAFAFALAFSTRPFVKLRLAIAKPQIAATTNSRRAAAFGLSVGLSHAIVGMGGCLVAFQKANVSQGYFDQLLIEVIPALLLGELALVALGCVPPIGRTLGGMRGVTITVISACLGCVVYKLLWQLVLGASHGSTPATPALVGVLAVAAALVLSRSQTSLARRVGPWEFHGAIGGASQREAVLRNGHEEA
jgi:ABC-type uncharacterized transport system permease subunit